MKSQLAFSIGAAVLVVGLLSASAENNQPSAGGVKPDADDTFTCQKEIAGGTTTKKQAPEGANTMTTKTLLETYYEGFAKKSGWESVISDDFKFVGGDMTKRDPIAGKAAYIQVIKRFSQLFTAMRIKEMMISDDRAYVLANYDYVFPRGDSVNGDVVELWKIKNGKLDTLTIFFDTLTFERLTKPPPKP